MSDYLWDKKGDPDTEVARLETLLGAFKHAPRPLELPAEAAPPEPLPARLLPFAPRRFAPRLLAAAALAAAVLLVVTMQVVSGFFQAHDTNEADRARAPEASRPQEDAPKAVEPKDVHPEQREVVRRMLEPPPGAVETKDEMPLKKVRDEKAAVESLTRGARRRKDVQTVVASRQRQKVLGEVAVKDVPGAGEGLAPEAMRTGFNGSSLVENTRLLTKEQLVYALRLTGTKLRDVREKAGGKAVGGRP